MLADNHRLLSEALAALLKPHCDVVVTVSDGRELYAFRYAYNSTANSLYYREAGGNVIVVSEPLDKQPGNWKPVPTNHLIVARGKAPVALEPFPEAAPLAAE